MHFKTSQNLTTQSKKTIVGGVNSPSRSLKKVGFDFNIFIKRAHGAYFWDEDNNRYIDYLAAFGPIILGHAHPAITSAITETAENGVLYGVPTHSEVILGQMIKSAIPSMDKIRFVNSGTEAVMTTIRLARAYTKRTKIIKFSGCYHGHFDLALIAAGSGPATLGIPDSEGISSCTLSEIITVPYNNTEALQQALSLAADEVAAILIEPIVGNFGIVLPEKDFLEDISRLAKQYGALTIYDEVITGFRFHYGGVQSLYKTTPDLTALGKIIGGGLPIGAYGGREEIMKQVAPEGGVYQAGTMAGNPLSIAAGIACLSKLSNPETYTHLEVLGTKLTDSILKSAEKYSLNIQLNRLKGAFSIHFTKYPVINYETAKGSNDEQFNLFFKMLLAEGIFTAPSKFEAWFITTSHTEEDISYTAKKIDNIFKVIAQKKLLTV